MCEEGKLYQLQIPEVDLISTTSSCAYSKAGLNETLSFFTDSKGKLVSFAYNNIDQATAAKKEKSAKKRRLMTTV